MSNRTAIFWQANQCLHSLASSTSHQTADSVKRWALRRVDATSFARMTDHQAELFISLVNAGSELLQEVHHG